MKNKTLKKLQDDIRSKFGTAKSGGVFKVTKSRKAQRKAARNEKKERRLAHHAKRHKTPIKSSVSKAEEPKQKEVKKKQKNKPAEKRKAEKPIVKAPRKQRKAEVYDAVAAREKRELRQLEKQLQMKKKKSLPKAFIDDGLDYLLDVVDKEKLKTMSVDSGSATEDDGDDDIDASDDSDEDKSEDEDEDDAESGDHDSEVEIKSNEIKAERLSPASKPNNKPGKKVRFADDVQDGGSDSEGGGEEIDSDGDADEAEEDEEITSEGAEDKPVQKNDGIQEDIYGRLVDAKGNVLPTGKKQGDVGGGAYIPPAKRAAMLQESSQNAAEKERLKKQMKGLLNRASESNMQSIAGAIEDLYMNHSRAAVNETLFSLIVDACVSEVMTPDRFAAEMTMLVSILHGNVGSEVGSFFLEHLTKRFDAQLKLESYGEVHTVDNILLLLAHLYNLKVAHHSLMFDIMTKLVDSFGEKEIELILLLLKTAGFSLRKDDPAALGQQISAVQKKAQEFEATENETSSRVHYMLDVLLAVRNNNVRRVPGADIERIDHLRRLAGSCIRGSGLLDNQLNVGLRDLLQAEEAGRWWLVGSAWDGRTTDSNSNNIGKTSTSVSSKVSSVVGSVSQKLIDVARKLHMNSDVRRSIFFVLMLSEDYLDAFQKVLQLGIKGQQEREIVVVAVECCKREAKYNPYYSHFLARLAGHDRRFMMALQFHMWDMFKTLGEMSSSSRHNLALMLAHLFSSQALPLSVLKVLEFGALDKATLRFLSTVLVQLLTTVPTSDVEAMFRRVAEQVKLQHLAEGLRLFLASSIKMKKLDVNKQTLKKHLTVASTELSVNIRTVL